MMKMGIVIVILIVISVLPSYLVGRWMLYKEIRKNIDITSKEKSIVIIMGLFGGLLVLYPSLITSIMLGMYGPLIVLDKLNLVETDTIIWPSVIVASLILCTIINFFGVILGKSTATFIIKRKRPNKSL